MLDARAATSEGLLVDGGVEVSKIRRKLDSLVVPQHRTIRVRALTLHMHRKNTLFDRQKPTHVLELAREDQNSFTHDSPERIHEQTLSHPTTSARY